MAAHAVLLVYQLTLLRVGRSVRQHNVFQPVTRHVAANGYALAKPLHVRHHGNHLLAVKRQGSAVQWSLDAVVHAVGQCQHLTLAGTILRIPGMCREVVQTVRPGACFEVTVLTAETIAPIGADLTLGAEIVWKVYQQLTTIADKVTGSIIGYR